MQGHDGRRPLGTRGGAAASPAAHLVTPPLRALLPGAPGDVLGHLGPLVADLALQVRARGGGVRGCARLNQPDWGVRRVGGGARAVRAQPPHAATLVCMRSPLARAGCWAAPLGGTRRLCFKWPRFRVRASAAPRCARAGDNGQARTCQRYSRSSSSGSQAPVCAQAGTGRAGRVGGGEPGARSGRGPGAAGLTAGTQMTSIKRVLRRVTRRCAP